MFNDELRKKTFEFSLNLILFLRSIPESQESSIIKRQLIRSASSFSANFRASCVSRSRPEWYSKISIVIEEADETRYWLELMKELYPDHSIPITDHLCRIEELIKIFGKARGKVSVRWIVISTRRKKDLYNKLWIISVFCHRFLTVCSFLFTIYSLLFNIDSLPLSPPGWWNR